MKAYHDQPREDAALERSRQSIRPLLKYISAEEIPQDECLFSAEALEAQLSGLAELPWSLIAVGDVMLGGRTRRFLAEHGRDYPFRAVEPLLRRSPVVFANLEGPFASKAKRLTRPYSYRVKPKLAHALSNAGVNLVTLANNHLLDCGRYGVVETLEALEKAGVSAVGGGLSAVAAHSPIIREIGKYRVGFCGYYWNGRCAATSDQPGCAMDTPEALRVDIRTLRDRVDRVVVGFHWGVPYERGPSPEDRAKARFAVDCGADLVIGHHQHIVQPFEVYCGRPIFYGVGNFAFGSGNSRAEGLLLGVRFSDDKTLVHVYPLYVKNRDPRVAYQPKVLREAGAERVLYKLAKMSGNDGRFMTVSSGRGHLELRPGLRDRTPQSVNRPIA